MIGALAALPLIGAKELPGKRQPGIAISIDDFNLSDRPGMAGWQRDQTIRTVLSRHGIKAAGFPAGKYVDNDIGRRALAAWSDDGHLLGNHSYSHAFYGGQDPAGEMADILRGVACTAR